MIVALRGRPRPRGRAVRSATVHPYVAEEFSAEEAEVLRRYFTNLDQPVFALVNLPEVVKGALFARYSRTHLSLRRLFLKEFVGHLDMTGDLTLDATVGLARAVPGAVRAEHDIFGHPLPLRAEGPAIAAPHTLSAKRGGGNAPGDDCLAFAAAIRDAA